MSSIAAGTSAGSALVSTGDTTGVLQLQVNGTTPSITLAANGSVGFGSTPGYGTSGQVLTSSGTGSAPTWTSLPPTAVAKGSVLGFTPQSPTGVGGTSTTTVFGTPNLFTTPMRVETTQMLSSNGSTTGGTPRTPSYSTYYGGWFCLMGQINATTTTFQNLYFSYDGFSWVAVSSEAVSGWTGWYAAGACVNDYNGDIYLLVSNSTTTIKIITSTDSGLTFGTSQTISSTQPLNISYGGMCFIDCGTQASSRAVAWYMDAGGDFALKTLAGNGTPSTGWATPTGGTVTGMSNMGYGFRQYGTKMSVVGDTTVVYDASTNSASSVVNSSIGIINSSSNLPLSLAFNNSYWISSTGTGVRYGTISGTTLTAVGTVTLSSSTAGTFYSTIYDGTYWYLFGNNGMWYTSAANPSSGWTKASPQFGMAFYTAAYSGYGSNSYTMFQRNPV